MRTKNIRKVLVDNAKYYRFKIGYTQEELAEKCDLIQEVAYQNARKNKFNDKQRKIFVLDNYFKGSNKITKFPSKHKIEKAIKNINYEMEKASQEFSKLFNYDVKGK